MIVSMRKRQVLAKVEQNAFSCKIASLF